MVKKYTEKLLSCAHIGRVQVILTIDNMLGLSVSKSVRYLGSPVTFLRSFTMRARTMDDRVSLNTKMLQIINAPENLETILEDTKPYVVSLETNMTCTHCTHRQPRCELLVISPPNTDPRPVENTVENESIDIGTPRLESCQQVSDHIYHASLMRLPYISNGARNQCCTV